jgi:hypothetical protein
VASILMRARLSLLLPVVLAGLAIALLVLALLPARYVATARVLLPPRPSESGPFMAKAAALDVAVSAERGSRVLSLRRAGADPAQAALAVNAFLRAHAADDGMIVIDEAGVPFAPRGPGAQMRAALGAAGLLLFVFSVCILKFKSRSEAPARSVVRQALRFAQLGQKTLLVDTGTRFRVVLSSDTAAALQPELKILASLAGGTLVVARQLR